MARDYIQENTNFEILGGYFSPVSDFYQKQGLAEAKHRVRMCELAVENSSSWLMVDSWESLQTSYQRTAIVLDHFQHELNGYDGESGIKLRNGEYKPIKIMLLAGGDLVQSFAAPDVWTTADLHHIIGNYGCLILERTGSDVYEFLLSHDVLYKHRHNVFVIKQLIYNDISSTKIRLFIRRDMSIKYLLPTAVVDYIYEKRLYHE
ncbi:Nicotinamide/nicotinic acid mononucleotide adenylyltransferase 1 [Entomortierella lignicola]|nr:Nicotinamide/nicotinic acid mononucleotide adenylyltransferase 1 [Entomortierella lignicola]